jgi:hypothetical protein
MNINLFPRLFIIYNRIINHSLNMLVKLLINSSKKNSGRRFFSRADILKNLDKSKVSRKNFIKKELTENPEFFKAFPHMQSVFNARDGSESQ